MLYSKRTKFNSTTVAIVVCLFVISSIEHSKQQTTTTAFILKATKSKLFFNQLSTASTPKVKPSSTQLFDLSEWRDQFFEVPDDVMKFIKKEVVEDEKMILDEPIREVCVLPFPLDDVLLQGETKELCLYENRFHQLFETSTKCHSSVVAMGLLAPPAGILQNMPLCEIENYRVMQGQTAFGTDFSILVTIRVVGRASLLYIQDEDDDIEFLRGWCVEINDEVDDKDIIDVGNQLADKLDGIITEIQMMEDKLMFSVSSNISRDDQSSPEKLGSTSEASMRRRLLEAEIVSVETANDFVTFT